MKTFEIRLTCDVEIEIDEDVINSVDENWRKQFYSLQNENEIVNHIVYNMVVNHLDLSQMDGFADMDDSQASIVDVDCYFYEY